MTLAALRVKLRSGVHPASFGMFVGAGCSRSAYRIGAYVVKLHEGNQCTGVDWPMWKKFGVRRAKHWVEGRWRIQHYYRTPTIDEARRLWERWTVFRSSHDTIDAGDVFGNWGFDERGRLVAYDW